MSVSELYPPGSVVWARVDGYPFWPARVCKPEWLKTTEIVPESVPSDRRLVQFYNDNDQFTILELNFIKPYSIGDVKTVSKRTKEFKRIVLACEQADKYLRDSRPSKNFEETKKPQTKLEPVRVSQDVDLQMDVPDLEASKSRAPHSTSSFSEHRPIEQNGTKKNHPSRNPKRMVRDIPAKSSEHFGKNRKQNASPRRPHAKQSSIPSERSESARSEKGDVSSSSPSIGSKYQRHEDAAAKRSRQDYSDLSRHELLRALSERDQKIEMLMKEIAKLSKARSEQRDRETDGTSVEGCDASAHRSSSENGKGPKAKENRSDSELSESSKESDIKENASDDFAIPEDDNRQPQRNDFVPTDEELLEACTEIKDACDQYQAKLRHAEGEEHNLARLSSNIRKKCDYVRGLPVSMETLSRTGAGPLLVNVVQDLKKSSKEIAKVVKAVVKKWIQRLEQSESGQISTMPDTQTADEKAKKRSEMNSSSENEEGATRKRPRTLSPINSGEERKHESSRPVGGEDADIRDSKRTNSSAKSAANALLDFDEENQAGSDELASARATVIEILDSYIGSVMSYMGDKGVSFENTSAAYSQVLDKEAYKLAREDVWSSVESLMKSYMDRIQIVAKVLLRAAKYLRNEEQSDWTATPRVSEAMELSERYLYGKLTERKYITSCVELYEKHG